MEFKQYLNENTKFKTRLNYRSQMIFDALTSKTTEDYYENLMGYVSCLPMFKQRLQKDIDDLKMKGLIG